MEQKQIKLNHRTIDYYIQYKKIKNCYLKIENGKVVVHAPYIMPITQIEALIIKNQDQLLSRLDHYIYKSDYNHLGFVVVFNKRYRILLKDMGIKKCVIHGNDLYVYHHDIEKTVTSFLKEKLLDYIREKIYFYLKTDFPVDDVEITLRKMKSRWGACFYKKNRVCFNTVLAHLDYSLIDYVIVHELCHFIEPNHSKQFYYEVKKRIPDYKERERKLAEVGI